MIGVKAIVIMYGEMNFEGSIFGFIWSAKSLSEFKLNTITLLGKLIQIGVIGNMY